MATDKFITLEELNTTTQALLSKINEQSNLKVDKINVTNTLDSGTKIGSIDGKDFYAPEGVTLDDLSNLYENLSNQIPQRVSDLYNNVGYITTATQIKSDWAETTTSNAAYILNKPAIIASATGTNAIIEGDLTNNIAIGDYSHAEGSTTIASGYASHAEGGITQAIGDYSHTEGAMTQAIGYYSHAEGFSTTASKAYAHAEGQSTIASGIASHAEGWQTFASGAEAHAEGWKTFAAGTAAHAEGYSTTASGNCSHTEGQGAIASGSVSHAEGLVTEASGTQSHAEGDHTIARRKSQHVFGEYNIADSTGTTTTRGTFVEIVGKGTSSTSRSNARTLDWNGNEVLAGKLTVGTAPTANMDVATKKYVDDNISSAIGNVNAFNISVVQSLPSSNIDTHTIYFISNSGDTGNIYDEYMYINNNWEKLGTTEIDLNKYWATHTIAVSYDSTNDEYSFFESKDGISGTDLTLEDVYNYLEEDFENVILVYGTELFYFSGATSNGIYIFTSPISHDKIYLDDNNLRYDAYVKPTYTAAEVGALPDTTEIPTDTADLTNGAGFITSYTETDPTVPAWAKAANKPTYTASEVGALPDTTVITDEKLKTELLNTTNTQYIILGNATATPATKVYSDALKFQQTANSALLTIGKQNSNNAALQMWRGNYITYLESSTSDSNHTVYLPSQGGTLALTSDIDNTKVKTTAADNNTEYNLLGTATTNNSTTAVSIYKQNLLSFAKTTNLSRLTVGSTSIPGVMRLYTSTNGANGYADLKVNVSGTNAREITFPDKSGTVSMTDDIPSVPSWALAANKPTYTAAEVGATTTSDVSSMISSAVSGITGFSTEVVQTLPATGVTGRFYFVPNNAGTNDIYEEYIYVNNAWEKLGNFDASNIDLSGYVQKQSGNNGTLYSNYIGTLISNDNGSLYLGHLDDIEEAEAGIHINEYGLDLFGMPDSNKPVTIRGLATPSDNYDAANKQYVDTVAANAGVTSFNGSTGAITYVPPVTSVNGQTGAVTITAASLDAAASSHTHTTIGNSHNPTNRIGRVSASYDSGVILEHDADQSGSSTLSLSNATITMTTVTDGNFANLKTLTINDGQISGLVSPTTATMAATKQYVDDSIPLIIHITDPSLTGTYTCDKTYSEISTALQNNRPVIAINDMAQMSVDVRLQSNQIYIPLTTIEYDGSIGLDQYILNSSNQITQSHYDFTIPTSGSGNITVTNTLQSGTLIATINGTNIYAPALPIYDGTVV